MHRFARVILPVLVAVTGVIGVYFLYVGARTIVIGRHVAIGFGFAGFGAVGLILGYALWSVRQQILTKLLNDEAEGRS